MVELSCRVAGNKTLQQLGFLGWAVFLSRFDSVASENVCVGVHKMLLCKPGKGGFSKILFVVANTTLRFPIKRGFSERATSRPAF